MISAFRKNSSGNKIGLRCRRMEQGSDLRHAIGRFALIMRARIYKTKLPLGRFLPCRTYTEEKYYNAAIFHAPQSRCAGSLRFKILIPMPAYGAAMRFPGLLPVGRCFFDSPCMNAIGKKRPRCMKAARANGSLGAAGEFPLGLAFSRNCHPDNPGTIPGNSRNCRFPAGPNAGSSFHP